MKTVKPSRLPAMMVGLSLFAFSLACAEELPKQLDNASGWSLVKWTAAGDITQKPEYLPTVNFKDGAIFGSAGVNSFRGECRATADGALHLNGIGINEMGGPQEIIQMEASYMGLLSKVSTWAIENDTLILSDATGKNQLHYQAKGPKVDRPLRNQNWILVGIQERNEQGVSMDALGGGRMSLKIGDENSATGFTGINDFSATVKIREDQGFSFERGWSTKMGGPTEKALEQRRYLQALEAVTRWEIKGERLMLRNEDKSLELVFAASP